MSSTKETNNRTGSRKEAQIIEAGTRLFMKHGIRRVSVEEVCREAKVSKMTFYKYYENKSSLALKLLERIFDRATRQYEEIMARDIAYEEKAKQIVRLKMEHSQNFSKELMLDIWQSPYPEIRVFIQERTKRNFELFKQDFIKAREKGEVRGDIKLEFVLYFLNHMIELIDDVRLTSMYPTTQELALELTNFFFYGIINKGCQGEVK